MQGHFSVAAGLADTPAPARALQPTDRFPIAGLSKTFTAAAVFLLRDEGRLDLDQPIAAYLPEFNVPAAQTITARHLLSGHVEQLHVPARESALARRFQAAEEVGHRVSEKRLGDLQPDFPEQSAALALHALKRELEEWCQVVTCGARFIPCRQVT